MAKRKDNQLGFDADAALDTLHKEAIKAGAVPQEDPRAGNPMSTAIAHLHTIQSDRCRENPCRVAGLCHALFELVQYRAQADGAAEFIEAANETEVMFEAGSRYLEMLDSLGKKAEEILQREIEQGPTFERHDHEVLCVLPRCICQQVTELQRSLELFEDKLRAMPSSFQLQQSSHQKNCTLLLTAVYQHLKWGGLKYAEIAKLVPDDLGRKGADDRVRHRVKEPNARSFVPAELRGKLRTERKPRAKKPKAETTEPGDSSR
jgi:hypothetical protein